MIASGDTGELQKALHSEDAAPTATGTQQWHSSGLPSTVGQHALVSPPICAIWNGALSSQHPGQMQVASRKLLEGDVKEADICLEPKDVQDYCLPPESCHHLDHRAHPYLVNKSYRTCMTLPALLLCISARQCPVSNICLTYQRSCACINLQLAINAAPSNATIGHGTGCYLQTSIMSHDLTTCIGSRCIALEQRLS